MIRYLSADYVFPVHCPPIKNGVVALNEKKEIVGLYNNQDKWIQNKNIERHRGLLTPGFINAHCHLELSHLYQKIPQNTKLIPFLETVMRQPNPNVNEIDDAMRQADEQMYSSGIVAVGDISNTINSKETKLNSKIYYHTFVEIIGFEPKKAQQIFDQGKKLMEDFQPLATSITPHAPYSVSNQLFRKIKEHSSNHKNHISIHNQESIEENYFYQYKSGGFVDFYKRLGKNIDFFKAKSRNSIQTIVSALPKNQKILFVHNTYSTYKDVNSVLRYGLNAAWCLCPNANLYIEGVLPKIYTFANYRLPIVLGTDSLASNHKLCILSEIKTILTNFPELDLDLLLKWACLNGAEYLGIDQSFGSMEIGKKPGINLISHTEGERITQQSTVTKLA